MSRETRGAAAAMSSAQAQKHKERMSNAFKAMEALGLLRKTVTPVLNKLLQVFHNEWDFIEAERYRVLVDSYFETQEEKKEEKSSRGGGNDGGGRVTRARRARSESDQYDTDDSPSPPRRVSPPPERPSTNAAASQGGRTPRSTTLAPVKREVISPVLKDKVARAVDFHSGASARTRAASQNAPLPVGGSVGGRGRGAAQNSAAAHEREKGKSPLVPQSSRPPPAHSKGVKGVQSHVSVRLDVSSVPVSVPVSSLPAPEGFEKVTFEKVDGVIIPTVRRPQNGGVPAVKQEEQRPPLARVKIEDEAPGNGVLALTPLLAKDPVVADGVASQTETQEAHVAPPDDNHHPSEDVIVDQSGVEGELPVVEVIAQPSHENLQIVPYGTVFPVGPSTAEQPSDIAPDQSIHKTPEVEPPKVEAEEPAQPALPVSNDVEEQDGNVLSLVDYEDDDPIEAPEQGTSGAAFDVVLIPEEPLEQVELQPELNDEEIRPNFIVSGSKREMVDAQVAAEPKRRKCEAESSTGPHVESEKVMSKAGASSSTPRRRLVLLHSPPADHPENGENDCTLLEAPPAGPSSTAGSKRKLILSASPSPEKNGGLVNGALAMVRRGEMTVAVVESLDNRAQLVSDARGEGSMNPNLKRVRVEREVEIEVEGEDPNAQPPLKHDPRDISRGTERVPIPYINDFTSETINHRFTYICSNVVYQNAFINFSLARLGDEDFCLDCVGDCLIAPHHCPCTRETGGEFAYTLDGRLKPERIKQELETNQDLDLKNQSMEYCASGWVCPTERARAVAEEEPEKCKGHVARKFVKECWHKCGCNMRCGNRVVQRGICRKLEVFFTNEGKGWGIRTAEDLPAGTFVCEYVGEIMTNMELDLRNQDAKKIDARQNGALKDTYPVLLDGDWCSEKGLKDEEALCLDATRYGNVARFINHRCYDANLIDVPVSIETPDRHYYHVAFFTCRDVKAGEELTWDYKIDFDDEEHPIEAFNCLCKSDFCRGHQVVKKSKK